MTWAWYEWVDIDAFNVWHEAIKGELGLPKLSIDQDGNPVEPLITEYTSCQSVSNKVIAMVEEDKADGLVLTDLRPQYATEF